MSSTSNTNKYNKYNQNQIQNRSLFLPIMLCSRSSSIKDVKLSHRRSLISNTTSSSPSIGCTGRHVKRNNRVIGYPPPHNHHKLNFTTTTTRTKADQHDHFTSSDNNTATYQKLRRFFSSRSLMTYTPTVASTASKVASETGRRAVVVDSGGGIRSKIDCGSYCNRKNSVNCDPSSNKIKSEGVIKIEELDPPLPVIKRAVAQQPGSGGGDSNLWKRRFAGGASLQSLQVQSIIHCNNSSLPAPVRTV